MIINLSNEKKAEIVHNKFLRKKFRLMRLEVTESWSNLHNERVIICTLNHGAQVKDEWGGETFLQYFLRET